MGTTTLRTRRTATALAAVATAAALLSGCSVERDGDTPNGTAPTGANPTSAGQQTQAPGTTGVGAIADVTKRECVQNKSGVWNLTGELKNSTKEKITYTVRADVTNLNGHASLANKTQQIPVEPGKTGKIAVTKIYTKTAKSPKKLGCVVTVTK